MTTTTIPAPRQAGVPRVLIALAAAIVVTLVLVVSLAVSSAGHGTSAHVPGPHIALTSSVPENCPFHMRLHAC